MDSTTENSQGDEPIDVLQLRMDIAQRGVDWRDSESQRLADRAASLLGISSVSLSVGAGFVREGGTAVNGWLAAALIVYIILAGLALLALRPRPMPRSTGYAVNERFDAAQELYVVHLMRLLDRGKTLDRMTQLKARLVTVSALLLMVEVAFLVAAMMLSR